MSAGAPCPAGAYAGRVQIGNWIDNLHLIVVLIRAIATIGAQKDWRSIALSSPVSATDQRDLACKRQALASVP